MENSSLLITQEEIKSLLDLPSVLNIVERTYRSHGEGKVILPPKLTLDLGEGAPWPPYQAFMNAMPAYLGDVDVAGIKWVGGFKGNPAKGLPYITGMILLINPKNGMFIAVLEGAHITALRTGAASAVFAKFLARQDSSVLTIIGAGMQGRMHLRALSQVFNLTEVRVTDIDEARLQEYCRSMAAEVRVNIRAARSLEEAVRGADIVCTVTAASEPLVRKEWLKSGVLVIGAGSYQELEADVILRADKIVVDNWAQASHRGALAGLVGAGELRHENVYGDIFEIVAGRKAGRETDDESIVGVPVGLGSLDIACAYEAYERALKQGAGTRFRFVELGNIETPSEA
jgi:ornithine cyclodeaminase/alanine dehydrogenase